jgi:leader peptidase (prepilin peptidase)/N-methyltransferase
MLRLEKWSRIIPFGPFLAGGAALWVFFGPQFVEWYKHAVLHLDY